MADPWIFSTRHRVEFAETDSAGIAHFSNFFRWMEKCEAAWFRTLGFPLFDSANGRGYPRVDAKCTYEAPLQFEDLVEIELGVREVRSSAITYAFRFRRVEPTPDLVTAQGSMTTVHAHRNPATGKIAALPLPDALRETIDKVRKGV